MALLGQLGRGISKATKDAGRSVSGVAKGSGQMVQALSQGDPKRFGEGFLKTLNYSVDPFTKQAGFGTPITDAVKQLFGLEQAQQSNLGSVSPEYQAELQNMLAGTGGFDKAGPPPPAFTLPGLGALPTMQAAQLGAIQNVSVGDPSQYAGDQRSLVQALQQQAAGQGPSVAQAMLKAEQDKLLNQQLAMAASQSGRSLPAAQRQVMQMGAAGQQQALQQAVVMRAQEQLAAQQQLGSALNAFRGQDLQRAGMALQAAQSNQDAALRQAMANQQAQQQANQFNAQQAFQAQTFGAEQEFARQQAEEQRRQAALALEAQKQQAALSAQAGLEQARLSGDYQKELAAKQAQSGLMGGVIGAVGSIGASMLSDKRAKHSIKDFSEKDLNEFFKAIKPKKYKYKNPEWGEGDRIGFIIQDIENTKVGKSLVRPHETGMKAFDTANLQGVLLAKLAYDAKKRK